MWYYVAFGLLTFMPLRRGIVLAVLLALLLGPKVLLLAPIWSAGVLLHRWSALQRMSASLAWLLALVSVLGIVLFHWGGVEAWISERMQAWMGAELHKSLTFSKFFLSDYLLTVLVFVNFASMRRLGPRLLVVLGRLESPIRGLAAYTLTLYLLHQPLFLFWGAVIRGDPSGYGFWWSITAMVAVSVVVVGHFTESRRHVLKRRLQRGLESLDARWRPLAPSR